MQDGDDRGQLAGFGQHLAGDRFDGDRLAAVGIDQADLSAPDLAGTGLAEQQAGDERREVRVVRLHVPLRRRRRLGATVNSSSAGAFISTVSPRLVGDDDRVRHRVDDQVQAVALGAGGRFSTRSF